MNDDDNVRRVVAFEMDQRIAAELGPAIREEFKTLRAELVQEGGEVQRWLGLLTTKVSDQVMERIGSVDEIARKAATMAKSDAKAEITAEFLRVQGYMPGASPPPGGGEGPVDGSGGDGTPPSGAGQEPAGQEPQPPPTSSAATAEEQARIGARVVDAFKRDPDVAAEKAFGWIERVLDLYDRRRNPWVKINDLKNDPSGLGLMALQSQTPGFLDEHDRASKIWAMGFQAGQGGKQLTSAPSIPVGLSSGPLTQRPNEPSAPQQPSAPVTASPQPNDAASSVATSADIAPATGPQPATVQQPSEVSAPRTFRMSDLA